jgi:hypothetical protein
MAATRSALIMAMWTLAVVVPAACADDNDRYGELAGAATELGGRIAGTDVVAIAAPSPCVVSESCPDVARVDLSERSNLSLDEIAAIATGLGWDADVVDARLIMLANEDDMSGGISLDSQGRVVVVVGED